MYSSAGSGHVLFVQVHHRAAYLAEGSVETASIAMAVVPPPLRTQGKDKQQELTEYPVLLPGSRRTNDRTQWLVAPFSWKYNDVCLLMHQLLAVFCLLASRCNREISRSIFP